jgi:hypothetical protein
MQFSYNPYEDEEYLSMAAGLDSRSRYDGWAWRVILVVKDHALATSLKQLQIDMREQKYAAFIEERDFLLRWPNITISKLPMSSTGRCSCLSINSR